MAVESLTTWTDRLALALTELVEALREEVRTEAATSPQAPDRLLSVPEAAAAMGVRRSLIYAEMGAGRLRSIKVGRRRVIPASAISDYLEAAQT